MGRVLGVLRPMFIGAVLWMGFGLSAFAQDQGAPEPEKKVMGEVELKHQVAPKYPAAAIGWPEEVRCLGKVFIGEDGAPFKVLVSLCPEVFLQATEDALMRWRWHPPHVGDQIVKAQITVGVTYPPSKRPVSRKAEVPSSEPETKTKRRIRQERRLERRLLRQSG